MNTSRTHFPVLAAALAVMLVVFCGCKKAQEPPQEAAPTEKPSLQAEPKAPEPTPAGEPAPTTQPAADSEQENESMSETPTAKEPASPLTIASPAFEANGAIPRKYSRDGDNISPPLVFAGVPEQTRELALIVDDPDAPRPEPWVHWVVYRIQPATSQLAAGALPGGAVEGLNSSGAFGYGGPAPPKGHGTHHYHFKLYALSAPLEAPAGLDKAKLLAAMSSKIIAEAQLVGTYER